MPTASAHVKDIYEGSDGKATQALYGRLMQLGPAGVVAVNLFRASKCSARAKLYRGGIPGKGSYKGMAYERKAWSINNLAKVLGEHAANLGITWGWQHDPVQPVHCWVLYVDLPAGQVSFHTAPRGSGPDYPGQWDGQKGLSGGRIVQFVEAVLAKGTALT